MGEYVVYILKSLANTKKHYIGLTNNLPRRLSQHNNGDSTYTKKYVPWEIETYTCFKSLDLAINFEKYLKHGSGKAFLKKRLVP